jgi:hypothetical protein
MEIETTTEAFAEELKNTTPPGITANLEWRPITRAPDIKIRGASDVFFVVLTFVKKHWVEAEFKLLIAWLVKTANDPRTKNITGGRKNIPPSEVAITRRANEELNIGKND